MYSVVIADDSKKICEGIKDLLEFSRPDVEVVGVYYNGKTLIDNLQDNLPDIIISDIRMPGADGLEICNYVRSRTNDTQIILITAFQEFEYAKKALDYRVSAFLVKPYTSSQLFNALDSAIQSFNEKKSYTDAVTDLYFSKRKELEKSVRDIYIGKSKPTEIKEQLLLDYTQPCNQLYIMEADIDSAPADILNENVFNFESPHLSSFLVSHNHLILFFSDLEYATAFFTDCKKEASFYGADLKLSASNQMNFTQWESYCYIRNLADSLVLAFKTMNVDQFCKKNENVLNSLSLEDTKLLLQIISKKLNAEILFIEFQLNISENPKDLILRFAEEYLNLDTSQSISDKIKQFILANYNNSSISVSKIAEHLSFNSDYISNHFKKETGVTITNFLTQTRIEQAKNLLLTTDYTVNEVANKVGFNDVSYFHRVFKKHTHITPSQFQRRSDKNED